MACFRVDLVRYFNWSLHDYKSVIGAERFAKARRVFYMHLLIWGSANSPAPKGGFEGFEVLHRDPTCLAYLS